MSAPNVVFILVCEGSSDRHLIPLLAELLVRHGAFEAIGFSHLKTGAVEPTLAGLVRLSAPCDLVFIHRDADSPDPTPRVTEIENGVRRSGLQSPFVPVIPIQETEAWLLADEAAIRAVVGRPSGTVHLGLPPLRDIERTRDPKSKLQTALAIASEQSGKRLDRVRRQFPVHRATLLQRLDPDGPVNQLPSWRQLDRDIANLAKTQHWG